MNEVFATLLFKRNERCKYFWQIFYAKSTPLRIKIKNNELFCTFNYKLIDIVRIYLCTWTYLCSSAQLLTSLQDSLCTWSAQSCPGMYRVDKAHNKLLADTCLHRMRLLAEIMKSE